MDRRRLALVALGVTVAGLTACSNDGITKLSDATSSTSARTVPETADQGTDATTTVAAATTTSAGVATTKATTTQPPTTPAPTQPPTTPAPTQPPTTAAPALQLYDEVQPPKVPSDHTHEVAPDGTLADGMYWVVYNGGETQTPDISVYEAYFGQACIDKAQENGGECDNDIYVDETTERDVNDLAFTDDVYLTVSDEQSQKSYWITPDELRTIRASSPSDGAPANYGFVPFPFLMTVKNGEITKFEQLWTP